MKRFNNITALITGLVLVAIISVSACNEIPPFIDLSEDKKALKDTNYLITTIPAAQDKNVLIEDISGVNCVNCPDAALKAEAIKTQHGKRIIIATLLPSKDLLPQFTDPAGGFTDLANSKINQLLNFITPPSGLPAGMINRGDFGNGRTTAYPTWDGYVTTELAKSTSVNMELGNTYDPTKRELLIDVKVTYTDNQTDTAQNLTVYLVENGIVGVQKTRTGTDNNYEFKHVLRDYATSALGDPLRAKLEKGRAGPCLMGTQWFSASFFEEKEPDCSPEAATSLGDARILWLVVV